MKRWTDALWRRALPLALVLPVTLVASVAARPLSAQEAGAQQPPSSEVSTPRPAAGSQEAQAQEPTTHHAGGEANLVIPDLDQVRFFGDVSGRTLLMWGLGVCALGLLFGLVIYGRLKRLPVHQSMRDISELIYETCKTYLITQGRFILVLWVFIGLITAIYFGSLAATVDPATGALARGFPPVKVAVILDRKSVV